MSNPPERFERGILYQLRLLRCQPAFSQVGVLQEFTPIRAPHDIELDFGPIGSRKDPILPIPGLLRHSRWRSWRRGKPLGDPGRDRRLEWQRDKCAHECAPPRSKPFANDRLAASRYWAAPPDRLASIAERWKLSTTPVGVFSTASMAAFPALPTHDDVARGSHELAQADFPGAQLRSAAHRKEVP
jgi:hypothetical protein